MKRIAAVVVGVMIFVPAFGGSALAQYTEGPAPTNEVEGAGGEVSFTGGDVYAAVIVAIALVTVGLVALFVTRRRTRATS